MGFRLWEEKDLEPFATLCKDVEGMQFFSRPYTSEESYSKMCEHIVFLEDHGYGFWAVDSKETKEFIGTIGFNYPSIQSFFTPCTQIGWCLSKKYWNQGLATEGAIVAIQYAIQYTALTEIFSYTIEANLKSIKVMQKIGMQFVSSFKLDYIEDDTIYVVYKKQLKNISQIK